MVCLVYVSYLVHVMFSVNVYQFVFQVMSTRGFTSTFSLFFGGALLLIVLNPVSSSSTLCETRCENAVPNLKRLKNIWHNVSKRVGGEGKSTL